MKAGRLPGVVVSITTLVLALGWSLAPYREVDTWWHLRVGDHILKSGQLVGTDPWAAFAERPYAATQWLPEVVAAWAVEHVGMGALLWLRALSVVTLTVLVYATARQRAGRLPSGIAATWALVASGAGLNPRPQLISFVLAALVVLACLRTVADRRTRWWLVPVFWLWACSHGLWSVGLAVMGVLLATAVLELRGSEARRAASLRFGGLWVACLVAVGLTPIGPRLLLTPFTVAGTAAGLAEEWQPTPVNNAFSVAAVGMVVVTTLLWLSAARRPRPWESATLVMSLGLTLVMWRLVPLGAILAAPLLAQALQARLSGPREAWSAGERNAAGAAWLAAVVVAGLVAAGPSGASAQRFPGPIERVDAALAALPRGTIVLDDFAISGWLLWAHPDLVPVLDLRAEIYSSDLIRDYRTMERVGPGWRDLVKESGATHALLDRGSSLADALEHRAGWEVAATEGDYVLLTMPAGARG